MKEKILRQSAMVQFLKDNVRGTAVLSVDIETVPEMRKTGNPFVGNVIKSQRLNGLVGFDYDAGVNRIAEREGKEYREAKPRKWGFLSSDRIFVCYKNDDIATHLRMKVQKSIDPRYFRIDNGDEISKETLKPFLPVKAKSSTQADLTGEVIERDITLENVKVLHFRGDVYTILSDVQTAIIQPETEPAAEPASEKVAETV